LLMDNHVVILSTQISVNFVDQIFVTQEENK
jgi:hypothetical protein